MEVLKKKGVLMFLNKKIDSLMLMFPNKETWERRPYKKKKTLRWMKWQKD